MGKGKGAAGGFGKSGGGKDGMSNKLIKTPMQKGTLPKKGKY